ncbi:hypothetical protein ILUMI_14950, partial [Ignelater luminosus]
MLFSQPAEVDLLIGSQVFFKLLCIGQICLGPEQPIFQKTRFGWVVSGPIGLKSTNNLQCHFSQLYDISDQFSRFWKLEHYPMEKVLSEEENACETQFVKSTYRNAEGRFVVSILFKEPVEVLRDSSEVAQKRLFSLERRLQANPELYTRYSSFMKEYEELAYMSFYVDDLLTGADDLEQARQICSQLSAVLGAGCFKLRKWISNDPKVLRNIPKSEWHPGILEFGSHERIHTLGLTWSVQSDYLMYSIAKFSTQTITKRVILSEISQIFDPLGL